MDRPNHNRLKIVLAEKEETDTWLSKQKGRKIEAVSLQKSKKGRSSIEITV